MIILFTNRCRKLESTPKTQNHLRSQRIRLAEENSRPEVGAGPAARAGPVRAGPGRIFVVTSGPGRAA